MSQKCECLFTRIVNQDADIMESVGLMGLVEFEAHARKHGIEPLRQQVIFDKDWNTGWRLHNVRRLQQPILYVHKGMGQVKLDDAAVNGLS